MRRFLRARRAKTKRSLLRGRVWIMVYICNTHTHTHRAEMGCVFAEGGRVRAKWSQWAEYWWGVRFALDNSRIDPWSIPLQYSAGDDDRTARGGRIGTTEHSSDFKTEAVLVKEKKKVVEVLRWNRKCGDVSETASHFWSSCDDESWGTKETFTKVLQSRCISFLSPFLSFLVAQILETSVNELFKMQTSFT